MYTHFQTHSDLASNQGKVSNLGESRSFTLTRFQGIALFCLGAMLFLFSNGRYASAGGAWLFPVCFLWVSRNPLSRYVFPVFPLTTAVLSQIAFWKFTFQQPDHFLFYLPFVLGLFFGLMFCLDRLVYPKLSGFVATLFLPALYTSFDFLLNLFNPFGTTGVLGYSQIGFLPFAQLASLTGMWGLTFMIVWFGSVVHWGFDKGLSQTKNGLIIYGLILTSVLVFGVARLTPQERTTSIQIAGIHSFDKERDGKEFWAALTQKDITKVKAISNKHLSRLIAATEQQAQAGAKIVVWSEATHNILKQDEDSVKNVLSNLAKSLHIYLITNPYSATVDGSKPENKILLFDPQGNIVLTHFKYGGAFLEGSVEGNRQLQTIATPYGKLSSLICWDADFPSVVRQVGQQKADILLIPASDWREIDPLHTTVAVFRGIENGCSVVRQVRNGLSIMTDPTGRTIAQMDHFQTQHWLNVGQVPTQRRWTLYPIIGDLVGWLAMLSTVVLAVFSAKPIHLVRLDELVATMNLK